MYMFIELNSNTFRGGLRFEQSLTDFVEDIETVLVFVEPVFVVVL